MKMIVSTFLFFLSLLYFPFCFVCFLLPNLELTELDCLSLIFVSDVFGQLFLFCWWVLQIFSVINGYEWGIQFKSIYQSFDAY